MENKTESKFDGRMIFSFYLQMDLAWSMQKYGTNIICIVEKLVNVCMRHLNIIAYCVFNHETHFKNKSMFQSPSPKFWVAQICMLTKALPLI